MKKFIYLIAIALFTFGGYAQTLNKADLAETTKTTAYNISKELNFNDNQAMFLYRAVLSTAQSRKRAKEQLADDPEKLKSANKKVDEAFDRMLNAKFSETEVASIKELLKKEK